ncbi:prealbumin-like fold domain-containing protein [Weissella confusa]|uniref:SpaA-like prealbumin fold domain-containing protein n=1 Tax=Weissella confusa TaxID=1583 RepID=A0AAJ2YV72_WEICO|nr:prealbumin-like fold domain-containing protein [Weissella confusa]NBA10660.1 hypothetical protein [Weissella confusa]
MAKWKNALLISTIVAPIAFGASPLGDALAAPKDSRPDTTPVVLHKQITSDSNNSGKQYWGNGHVNGDGNPFTETAGWKNAGAGYTFTAYPLPTKLDDGSKLITFDKNSKAQSIPVISDEEIDGLTVSGGALKWSDVIQVVAQPVDAYDSSNKDNPDYVIQYSLVINAQYQEAFATWAEDNLKTGSISDATNGSGAADFNLDNGNWVILETGVPSTAGVTQEQQGMVVSLPMMDAYSIANASDKSTTPNYWFSAAGQKDSVSWGENALNLYPKNFADTSDVSVLKTDSKSGEKLSGFGYTVFVASAANAAAIQEQITADVKDGKTVQESLKANASVESVKAEVKTVDGQTPKIQLDPTTDLTVGTDDSYFIVESSVPTAAANDTQYLLDATIQRMIFDEKSSNDKLSAGNETIAFHDAVWDVNNYKPGIDKSITIGEGADSETFGDKNQKNGGDDEYGIDRGEDFVWNIVSDLSVDASDYNKKYQIDDTIPYQTNWTKAAVTVAGISDLFNLEHIMPTETNGGLTGHGISYGNNSEPATALDTNYTGIPAGTLNSAYLELTVPDGTINKLTGVSEAVTKVLEDNGVDSDATLQDFLNKNIAVDGVSSQYHFTEKNRLAVKDEDGRLTINVNDKANQLFSALAAATDKDSRVMDIALTAHANSAAQAAATITNEVDFDVENNYAVSTDKDTVNTFDAGWEIVKTDSSGQPLAGAGFDLAVAIPGSSDAVKTAALLNNFYDGLKPNSTEHIYDSTASSEAQTKWKKMFLDAAKSEQFEYSDADNKNLTIFDDKGELKSDDEIIALAYSDDAAATTKEEKRVSPSLRTRLISMMTATDYQSSGQGVLYFMHTDAETGASMPEMDMSDNAVMGDVIWTPVRAWATTHKTGSDGYIQYCGLAAGDYALIEKYAPEGYALIDNKVELGNEKYDHAESFTLGVPGTTNPDGTSASGTIDGKPTDDDIHIKNYQKSMFPLVGGIGTLFAVIAGLLAMGLALLKRKKDMKNEA